MNNDKLARDMARLEEARRRTQERLDKQQARINQRFERIQDQLERKLGKTSETQTRIIDAALELLKQDGLASLTQRKLARELNMQAPALYWHFKNKEVLIDYMAEAILSKEFTDLQARTDEQGWREWLTGRMIQLRKAMLAYPEGARVVAGAHLYPAVTLARLSDISLESLESDGVDLQAAHHIVMTAISYTFGYVIEEQAAPTEEQLANIDMTEFLAPYPTMARAIAEVNFTESDGDEDYLIGLNYIIRGSTTTI